jgi:hypothetical protein
MTFPRQEGFREAERMIRFREPVARSSRNSVAMQLQNTPSLGVIKDVHNSTSAIENYREVRVARDWINAGLIIAHKQTFYCAAASEKGDRVIALILSHGHESLPISIVRNSDQRF